MIPQASQCKLDSTHQFLSVVAKVMEIEPDLWIRNLLS